MARYGYVPATVNGLTGIAAFLDEYRAVDHYRGKLLLKEGHIWPPVEPSAPDYVQWRFEEGDVQIMNVPENEAVRLIRATIGAAR